MQDVGRYHTIGDAAYPVPCWQQNHTADGSCVRSDDDLSSNRSSITSIADSDIDTSNSSHHGRARSLPDAVTYAKTMHAFTLVQVEQSGLEKAQLRRSGDLVASPRTSPSVGAMDPTAETAAAAAAAGAALEGPRAPANTPVRGNVNAGHNGAEWHGSSKVHPASRNQPPSIFTRDFAA